MAKPDAPLVRVWRDLAEEGFLYAEISRMHPPFSVDQVRGGASRRIRNQRPGSQNRYDSHSGRRIRLRRPPRVPLRA